MNRTQLRPPVYSICASRMSAVYLELVNIYNIECLQYI